MKEARHTFFFSLGSILAAVLLLVHAGSEKYVAGIADYGFSPVFFPEILLIVWLGLSLVLAIKSFLGMRLELEDPDALSLEKDANRIAPPILCLILTVLYSVLMVQIGFLFSSVLYSIAFMLIFGYRRMLAILLISTIFPVILWYVFNFSLHMPLPTSPWFSRI
jgi:hypothetical protein